MHDGKVPIRRAGLGTRRLLAFALQRGTSSKGGITLIDEVEHGLEPHRIRQLIKKLAPEDKVGQIIMSSHSPVPLVELSAESLQLVRSQDGNCTRRLEIRRRDWLQNSGASGSSDSRRCFLNARNRRSFTTNLSGRNTSPAFPRLAISARMRILVRGRPFPLNISPMFSPTISPSRNPVPKARE